MIPKSMESFLKSRLPERTWQNRLARVEGMCFMEFGMADVERLGRLGIQGDTLGPRLVACLWDDEAPLEVGGYLVVDNLAMGRPAMGGIRLLPETNPAEVFYLARAMTLKNAAADLPYGGAKAAILVNSALTPEEHDQVMQRFARLLMRYSDIFLPGPDVGLTSADMKTIAIENGLDHALSKPAEMGGNHVDELGAGGGGLILALDELLIEMPRLRALPQFSDLRIPQPEDVTVMFQGFGGMAANAAHFLGQVIHGARLIGVSDTGGFLYDEGGLPAEELFDLWRKGHPVVREYYRQRLENITVGSKFSNAPNDLLREDAFCLIPASPVTHYIDTAPGPGVAITAEQMGRWTVIIEAANIYSPDPAHRAMRARLERAVYRQRGVLIAPDYLVNSGSVIFAAQEHRIKTPPHLRIPETMLGNRPAVETWLAEHAAELQTLAEQRRQAAEKARADVIRRNMREMVELLAADADLLPSEAAEQLSIRRIATRESDRTAVDIMESIITIPVSETIHEAAKVLVEAGSPILAVISAKGELLGVVTDWDITRASALNLPDKTTLDKIMTRHVVTAAPGDSVLELVRKLEYHEISAMPVVSNGAVLGMINTDMLSRRTLLRLLQSQIA